MSDDEVPVVVVKSLGQVVVELLGVDPRDVEWPQPDRGGTGTCGECRAKWPCTDGRDGLWKYGLHLACAHEGYVAPPGEEWAARLGPGRDA